MEINKNKIIRKVIDEYLPLTGKEPGKLKICEIGCGGGFHLLSLKKYGELYGIEPFAPAVTKIKTKDPSVKIIEGYFPESSFPENSMDIVLMLDFLEHTQDDVQILRDVRNMLSESGIAIITVPAFQFLWSELDELSHHSRRYTAKKLKEALKLAEFRLLYLSYFNTFLFLPAVLFKLLFSRKKNAAPQDVVKPVESKLFEFILSSERFFLSHIKFPFGISLIAIAQKSE